MKIISILSCLIFACSAAIASADTLSPEQEKRKAENLRRMYEMSSSIQTPVPNDLKEMSGYAKKVIDKFKSLIIFKGELSKNTVATVGIECTERGEIIATKLTESSGNKAWDEAVLSAIKKAGSIPVGPDEKAPKNLTLVFRQK